MDRIPKVRTNHHRNKEEAARLQKFVDRRMATERPLQEAIEFAQRIDPLPRCEHGSCLRDGGGERLEPPCGCRLP